MDADSARWVNTPVPSANSCTMIMGPAATRLNDGRVHVELDNLVLNAGSHSSVSPYQSNSPSLDPSSPKKRRFNVFGGPLPSTMSLPGPVASTSVF